MEPAYKTLTKQYSTGMINARNNARNPSNEPKNTPIYGPKQLFRPKPSKHNHSIKKSMPLSQALIENAQRGRINNNTQNIKHTRKQKSVARGVNNHPIAAYPHPTSRVYVTTYVRQEFASKIRYYNKTVLKQYEDVGLIPKPEFEDMYPMDSSTGKYMQINPFGILTPQQVYVVMLSTNCHVCARNLASLPNSHLCVRCHVVGFCEKHFGGPARVTKHDCYSPFIKVE